MVLFWSFHAVFVISVFHFGCFAHFGGFVSLISVVLYMPLLGRGNIPEELTDVVSLVRQTF